MAEVNEAAVETPAAVPAEVQAKAEVPAPKKARSLEAFDGVDWSAIPEDKREALQDEISRRFDRARKNVSQRTRKEVEAFYQGRESVAKPEPRAAPQKPAELKEPARGDFQSYEDYNDARSDFVARKAAREERTRIATEEQATQAAEARTKAFTTFQTKVKTKFPDIEARLEAIGDIVLPAGMDDAIAESDVGPDILDHFARNPKDCERIASLAPSAALREIGKLEARLEGAKPAAAAAEGDPAKPTEIKKPSAPAAPAPIKPGGGSGSASDDMPRDSDKIDDWMKKSHALDRKKAGR